MDKTTVLARIQYTIEFTEETVVWMNRYFPEAWFTHDEGSALLREYGGTWREIIESKVNQEVQGYFRELGVSSNNLPFVSHAETYKGSWIYDATIVMLGSVGLVFAVLNQTKKKLPAMAENLSGLKTKLQKQIDPNISKSVSETLYSIAQNSAGRSNDKPIQTPPPPSAPIKTNFVIDARPLASLTPSLLKTHKIHLSVGISRDSFTLENLGDDALRDIRIGVFRTKTQRNQWSYEDSYMSRFPLVSSHQTVVKQVGDFIDKASNKLDFSDGDEVYVDCWVQDSHGIYLFQFFLEKE
jgi:hypothetical protein